MQNKPGVKNWKDVQMVISAIAVTLTLGLWNLIASNKPAVINGQTDQANINLPPNTYIAVTPAMPLLPGQILLLGGVVPQQSLPQAVSAPQTPQTTVTNSRRGKGGGGGTVTTTHSSHP